MDTKHKGDGSTLIVVDMYLGKESNLAEVISPEAFHKGIRESVVGSDMQLREASLLDVWHRPTFGPATVFQSISESHVRAATLTPEILLNYVRLETWPDDEDPAEAIHINAEAQLCDFSRPNMQATEDLVWSMIERVQPHTAYLFAIRRGPGPVPVPLWRKTYVCGESLLKTEHFAVSHQTTEKVPLVSSAIAA